MEKSHKMMKFQFEMLRDYVGCYNRLKYNCFHSHVFLYQSLDFYPTHWDDSVLPLEVVPLQVTYQYRYNQVRKCYKIENVKANYYEILLEHLIMIQTADVYPITVTLLGSKCPCVSFTIIFPLNTLTNTSILL